MITTNNYINNPQQKELNVKWTTKHNLLRDDDKLYQVDKWILIYLLYSL